MNSFILFITEQTAIAENIKKFLMKDFDVSICPFDEDIVETKLETLNIGIVLINLQNMSLKDIRSLSDMLKIINKKYLPIIVTGTKTECEDFGVVYEDLPYKALPRPIPSLSVFCDTIKQFAPGLVNQNKIVLLVDDDGRFLRTMKLILEERYKVNLANSAMTAMASMTREKPDLILLDYEMPICDGQKFLEMIRTTEETKDLPVIVLTGVKNREKILEIVSLNVQGYLLKGTEAQEILEFIQDFFDKNTL